MTGLMLGRSSRIRVPPLLELDEELDLRDGSTEARCYKIGRNPASMKIESLLAPVICDRKWLVRYPYVGKAPIALSL
jgi:hypothetical protein